MINEHKILAALARRREEAEEDLEAAKELYKEGQVGLVYMSVVEERHHGAVEALHVALKAIGG